MMRAMARTMARTMTRTAARVRYNAPGASQEPSRRPENARDMKFAERQTDAKRRRTSNGEALRYGQEPISNRQLIHCPGLDTDLTCTKQTAGHVSNRQFFAFLKLPDTSRRGCRPEGRRYKGRAKHGARRTGPGQSRAIRGIATGAASSAPTKARR